MKRTATIALVLLLAISTALAAGGSLSITSSQSLDSQFGAFREYLDELPRNEHDLWLAELALICREQQEDTTLQVWIPESGKRFHKHAECSGMKNPRQVPRQEAVSLGLEPCKRCKP
ncbi:MAG: hypothetical protein PHP02_00100 [Eubacteriales bacterium]|nr:hypothetical protein [Eubacteriales bacterium]